MSTVEITVDSLQEIDIDVVAEAEVSVEVVETAPVTVEVLGIGPQGAPGETGPPGVNPLGAWSPVVTYHPDDLVTRDGSSWLATIESTGVDPAADASSNPVGSFVAPSPLALGSPTAIATGFTVDRSTNVVGLNVQPSWVGAVPGGVTAGIATAINVPGVGIDWLGQGNPPSSGKVTLDNAADLSVGVRYWMVLLGATGVMVEHGDQLVTSHMAWSGEFFYGSGDPTNTFGTYASPVVLYGTTGDDAWQLFVAQGDSAPVKVLTQAEFDALPVKDPKTVYFII